MTQLEESYKEWLIENQKWLIETLGYQSYQRRPFFALSEEKKLLFVSNNVFSYDDLLIYLAELLELERTPELVIDEKPTPSQIQILSPHNYSQEEVITSLIEKLLLRKLNEIGIYYENNFDDTLFVVQLGLYYGVIQWLILDGKVRFQEQEIDIDFVNYILATCFATKPDDQIIVIDILGEGTTEKVRKIISDEEKLGQLKKDKVSFPAIDEIINSLNQAKSLYNQGYFPLAISTLENICQNQNKRSDLWNTLGYYQQRAKQFNESIASFEKSLELDPENELALSNVGLSYLLLHDFEAAKKYLVKAEKISPNNPLVLRNIGIFQSANNNFSSAEHYFNQSLQIHPRLELTHFYYGILCLQQGKKEEAIKHFTFSKDLGEKEGVEKLDKIQ